MQPMGNKVLIRPDTVEEKLSAGGVLLPQRAQKKSLTGQIVAIGRGLTKEDGTILTIAEQLGEELNLGDRVMYNKIHTITVQHDGVDHVLVDAEDLFGIISDDTDVTQVK